MPTTAGPLTAVVTTDSQISGTAVQVATVTPVVTPSTMQIANSNTLIINGFGFDPTAANNSVAFNLGAVGTVTAASATQLTVTFSTQPSLGALNAVVTTNSVSSGAAVQVASVISINLSALPDWTINRPYTPTVTATGGTGPYTFSLSSGSLPTGLTLNSDGTFTGSPTATGAFTFNIQATQSAFASGSRNYTVNVNAPPTVSVLSVTQWTNGKSGFTGTMTINNGTSPLSIVGVPTGLPTGMTLQLVGNTLSFTGTPSVAGVFNGSVTIMDLAGAQATQNFSITINPAMTFAPASLPGYTAGHAYSQTITTAGGTGTRTVQYALSGPLPVGLSISPPSPTTGAITISGTPTSITTITITVMVTDAVGAQTVSTYTLTGTALLPPSVSAAFGPFGQVIELVNSQGVLTQVDAFGTLVVGGGVRAASVAFVNGSAVLLVTFQNGGLAQYDAAGAHEVAAPGSGVQDASVAFGPFGEVIEVVNSQGVLTQFDAFGALVVGGGARAASVAFVNGSAVLLVTFQNGGLAQYDAAGAHALAAPGSAVQDASAAFTPAGQEVLDVIFLDRTLWQLDATGGHFLGPVG
jgi:hypothetical protein